MAEAALRDYYKEKFEKTVTDIELTELRILDTALPDIENVQYIHRAGRTSSFYLCFGRGPFYYRVYAADDYGLVLVGRIYLTVYNREVADKGRTDRGAPFLPFLDSPPPEFGRKLADLVITSWLQLLDPDLVKNKLFEQAMAETKRPVDHSSLCILI